MAAIKALQLWCKIQCDGYRDVAIVNMTTSFRDGLAFCALIHKFRPDLINFESLSKDNVYDNNHLAFCVAEEHLGIPALLDAEDMVALPIPDRLSILTYVSQYYNYFNSRSTMGLVGGLKRPAEGSKEEPSEKKNLPVAKIYNPKELAENHTSPFTATKTARENRPPSLLLQKSSEKNAPATLKQQPLTEKRPSAARAQKNSRSPGRTSPSRTTVLVESSNKTGTLNSKCVVCGSHVHLVQRHLVDGKLYHRSCFKSCECPAPVQCGVSRMGQERNTLLISSHRLAHIGPTMTEGGPQTDSDPSPPDHVSVLCSPVSAPPRPLDPAPAPQPWMDSAQRTQEARRKFFLSADPAPQPSTHHRSEPLAAGSASASGYKLEKERAQASITKKTDEGNCNNNNKAYSCGLRAQTTLGSGCCSTAVPNWRQERPASTTAEGGASRFCLSPTSPSPRSKESLQTDKAMGGCGVLADWQLKLRASPNTATLQYIENNCVTSEIINSSDGHVTHQAPPSASALSATPLTLCFPHKPLDAGRPPHGPAAWGFKNEIHSVEWSPSDGTLATGSSPLDSASPRLPAPEPPFHGSSSEIGDVSFKNSPASERIKHCHIPMEEITKELQEIENSLSDLEKEGIDLERRLRYCEEEGSGDVLMDPLMVDWFRLIQKKQSYIRRESEIMYIAKSQDLEELQPGVEGELRRLMNKPEHLKSATERKRETDLMKRLVEIVNDRNAIVDILEKDRLREEEEDQQLYEMMQRLDLKTQKARRKSSFSKLFRRRSKKTQMEE
ncbi:MICAL-like protein 2a [Electrophorus electricus]|uniref:MICAL-like protein 2a n=1 Tax=Electrophorus electricus TaxID=8005 RepID=UPI0015D0672A|nr:MICAL-like protein 2a [Electrophorus electricus]